MAMTAVDKNGDRLFRLAGEDAPIPVSLAFAALGLLLATVASAQFVSEWRAPPPAPPAPASAPAPVAQPPRPEAKPAAAVPAPASVPRRRARRRPSRRSRPSLKRSHCRRPGAGPRARARKTRPRRPLRPPRRHPRRLSLSRRPKPRPPRPPVVAANPPPVPSAPPPPTVPFAAAPRRRCARRAGRRSGARARTAAARALSSRGFDSLPAQQRAIEGGGPGRQDGALARLAAGAPGRHNFRRRPCRRHRPGGLQRLAELQTRRNRRRLAHKFRRAGGANRDARGGNQPAGALDDRNAKQSSGHSPDRGRRGLSR